MSGVRSGPAALVLTVVAASACGVAAGLALARATAPSGRRGIELVAFTPTGLPAALVALAAGLALLLLRRRSAVAVLPLAAGLAGLHAWWLAPMYGGAVPSADTSAVPLVVMTQNFEYGDASALAGLVDRHHVDVLVLTDTTDAGVAAVVATGIGDELPFDTLDNGRGSVVWSRHPITSDAFISDAGDSRVVTLAPPEAPEVTLFAVHPTPPYQDNGAGWASDWRRLLDAIGEPGSDGAEKDLGAGLVVAGDLNATADHWPLRELHGLGVRDVAEQLNAGPIPTWPANGTRQQLGVTVPPLLALDHVLTRGGLVPVDEVVTDDVGSDHRGVIATLLPAR